MGSFDQSEEVIQKIIDKEKFEDTKGVIGICKSKKDRQHNSQKIKKRSYQILYKNIQKQ
jgi:hypothetical protein